MDQFGLVQTIDGFGQGIVVAVPLAADGRLDAGLGQALGMADGNRLRSAIRMVDRAGIPLWLTSLERLLQGIQNEVGAHRTTDSPADDPAGKDIDDEGDIDEPRPRGNMGEIGDLELIRPIRLELAMDPILRTRRGRIAEGGSHHLAAHRPPQAEAAPQAFNGAARHLNPFLAAIAARLDRHHTLGNWPAKHVG